jgi:superoxide dismutase
MLNIDMAYNFIKEFILEQKSSDKLTQLKLPYARGDLEPVMSEDTINYHYKELYGGYVNRFNKGEILTSTKLGHFYIIYFLGNSKKSLQEMPHPEKF